MECIGPLDSFVFKLALKFCYRLKEIIQLKHPTGRMDYYIPCGSIGLCLKTSRVASMVLDLSYLLARCSYVSSGWILLIFGPVEVSVEWVEPKTAIPCHFSSTISFSSSQHSKARGPHMPPFPSTVSELPLNLEMAIVPNILVSLSDHELPVPVEWGIISEFPWG